MTRHICTNIDIVPNGPAAAEGLTYFAFYKADGGAAVCELDGPDLIGEYRDSFVLTPQGWKFQKRKIVVIFGRRDL